MNYNSDQLRTFLKLEERIREAVLENNAVRVRYYCMSKDYLQTCKLIVRLRQLNSPNCGPLITFLRIKIEALERDLDDYENSEN